MHEYELFIVIVYCFVCSCVSQTVTPFLITLVNGESAKGESALLQSENVSETTHAVNVVHVRDVI